MRGLVKPSLYCLLFSFGAEFGGAQQLIEKKSIVQSVTFKVELNSLSPAKLSLEEGDYDIVLRNGIYKEELTLVLDNDKGEKLAEKKGRAFAARTDVRHSLKPGKHVIRVAGRPKLSAELEVVARKEAK